ncbi:MAG: iron ABC transporter permease [Planctomycetota bacterium]|nr:iron ABC transporter permease [Planctomycetota bacterium]
MRSALAFAALALALGVAIALRLGLDWPAPDLPRAARDAILELRLIRVAIAIVVGASLAIAGVLLQCLLRNPLASPDLIGMGPGAGLALTIAAFLASQRGHTLAPLGYAGGAGIALAGAFTTLALVYALSRRRASLQPTTLVLVGVVISMVCGSGTVALQQLLPDRGLSITRWFLGALDDDAPWSSVGAFAILALVAGALASLTGPWLDASTLAPSEARSLGVPLARLRVALFIASGVLTAAAVTLAGPVAFVGLVAPHLARLALGARHRILVPAAAFIGAALVVAADALVSLIDLGAGRLPVGIVTTLIGAPVFITMLRTRERSWL